MTGPHAERVPGVRALSVCPFCRWPNAPLPARQDNAAAGGRMTDVYAETGAMATTDEIHDHLNEWHITDENLPDD